MPSNCTDLLQPIDLSVNKPFKDYLRAKFQSWYSEKVATQLEAGRTPKEVLVDTKMSIMKEISVKWMISAFDYVSSHPEIIRNGFKEAGIVNVLKDNFV